jgi:hypothetical protein
VIDMSCQRDLFCFEVELQVKEGERGMMVGRRGREGGEINLGSLGGEEPFVGARDMGRCVS